MTNSPHSLAGYWSGIHKALSGRLDSVKEYLKHPASGLNAENYFRDLLRDYLPHRYAVESGFVVNAAGDRSDFMDVLIVDCMHIAPLSAESHFKVFPAEAVVGAVEITSAPKAAVKRSDIAQKISKLQDDIMKLGRLRDLAKDRQYLDSIPMMTRSGVALQDDVISYTLAPRAFLMTCGDEWVKPQTYEKNLMNALTNAQAKEKHSWVNAAFSMRHGMFHFRPYTENNEHSRIPTEQNALLEFIMFLSRAVSEFRTSRIDVTRYRPTVPRESESREGGGG